ncbi:MAG: transcriptional regulator, TetR family-like protein [Ramlibacter sp.]|nr:transcriptional regulator, TetR family-like protein [Ramlibacter sp.]
MDAKTQKSELTRAAIVGAGLDLASAEGLEAITLQAVADRIGLSKSGVFSRIGSREALQKAVIEEFGRRFLADVFVPAMQLPKGLPRLDEIMNRWIVRTRDIDARSGCIFSAGAFELDDREGPLARWCWVWSTTRASCATRVPPSGPSPPGAACWTPTRSRASTMFLPPQPVHISHDCAKKGTDMFTILLIAAVYGGWRAVRAALESLRGLPRNNEDMIFY